MTLLGHPAGLFLLFFVEMWERFSYYGMRGLLVLYLVQSTHPQPDPTGFVNPGRGWSRGDASLLYGWYTGLAYLLPIVGGWIADRLLGTHRSMVIGGLLIALGHLVLAVSGVGSLARTDAGMSVFVFGLALIVIGTGHFKPCVSVMVGQLYEPGDARRDGAFTIFYMGINLGAFLSAFVCGTLGERGPTATIFVFMLFNAVFWLAFEQAGSSLNLFTDLHTNRMLGGFEVPTTWFQSVNAGLIFLLAPLFAGLWSWLGHRGRDPGQPVKIALGLGFLSLGYVFMVWAGRVAADPGVKASMAFVLATYFWHTVGELCLSPTGLSYVTKAAPDRYVSFLMGVWFISTFLANLGGGLVASQVEAIERGEIALPWHLGGQADFFMLFVVSAGAAGLLIFLLAPRLGRLTRGAV